MTACHTDNADGYHQESLYSQAITDIIKYNEWASYFFQGQMEGAIKPTETHIWSVRSVRLYRKTHKSMLASLLKQNCMQPASCGEGICNVLKDENMERNVITGKDVRKIC